MQRGYSVAIVAVLICNSFADDEPIARPIWNSDLVAAQRIALRDHKPLLLVFTANTPECTWVREQIATDGQDHKQFDKVVWVQIDWSKQARDRTADARRADRIERRFSIRHYPQVLLVDPLTLKDLVTRRNLFRWLDQEIESNVIGDDPNGATSDALGAVDRRADEFQLNPTIEFARLNIFDEDVVLASLALSFLSKNEPQRVEHDALRLLQIPQLRHAVCEFLITNPSPKAIAALARKLRQPADQDLNLTQYDVIQILGACGDDSAIAIIEPFAKNDATRLLSEFSVEAMARIGTRHPDSCARIRKILLQCFPGETTGDADRENASKVKQARAVHDALTTCSSAKIIFWGNYDYRARRQLLGEWNAVLDENGHEKPSPLQK